MTELMYVRYRKDLSRGRCSYLSNFRRALIRKFQQIVHQEQQDYPAFKYCTEELDPVQVYM
jgi:hypothetical protein